MFTIPTTTFCDRGTFFAAKSDSLSDKISTWEILEQYRNETNKEKRLSLAVLYTQANVIDCLDGVDDGDGMFSKKDYLLLCSLHKDGREISVPVGQNETFKADSHLSTYDFLELLRQQPCDKGSQEENNNPLQDRDCYEDAGFYSFNSCINPKR